MPNTTAPNPLDPQLEALRLAIEKHKVEGAAVKRELDRLEGEQKELQLLAGEIDPIVTAYANGLPGVRKSLGELQASDELWMRTLKADPKVPAIVDAVDAVIRAAAEESNAAADVATAAETKAKAQDEVVKAKLADLLAAKGLLKRLQVAVERLDGHAKRIRSEACSGRAALAHYLFMGVTHRDPSTPSFGFHHELGTVEVIEPAHLAKRIVKRSQALHDARVTYGELETRWKDAARTAEARKKAWDALKASRDADIETQIRALNP